MTDIYPIDFKLQRGGKWKHPQDRSNSVTGVSESSQQSSNLKDEGYRIP
ncbi:hypothetical protein ACK3F5_09365 [Photorhabdus asymbiotica UENP]